MPRPLPLALTAGAAAAAVSAPAVSAEDVVVTAQIAPGHLAIQGPTGGLQLRTRRDRGTARMAAAVTVPFAVTDTRGSGAGWAISVAATVRTAAGAPARGVRVTVRGFRIRCAGCTPPVDRIDYPIVVPRARPARVFAAARRTGMGEMRLGASLGLTAPAGARPQAYSVALRMTQATGP